MRITKTFLLSGKKDKLDASDILAINRDLENIFTALQIIEKRPRTVTSDPKDATAGNRPKGTLSEIVYYSGKLYFCTDASTPTWELITST